MIIFSLYRHNRLRLMRSLHPSPCLQPQGQALGATLRAACAVQIGYPADLSCLSFLRQRARVHCAHPPAYNRRGRLWAQPYGRLSPCKSSVLTICPSTRVPAMLSVAGARWRKKSCAFIAPIPLLTTAGAGSGRNPTGGCHRANRLSCRFVIASPGEKSGLEGHCYAS